MAIKAGRVGVNPADVDPVNGHISPESVDSYTKAQADAKFETQTNASTEYAKLQPKTLAVPISMLQGSLLVPKTTVEDVIQTMDNAMTNAELTNALTVTNDASQITGSGVTINDCVKAKAGNIRVYAIRFTSSGDVAAGTNIISGIDKPLLNAGGIINPIFADSSGTQYPMTSAYSGGNLLIKTVNAIPSGTSVRGTVVYIASL